MTLSTSSVYPESTQRGFELARELGFDGVEVMVGLDGHSADVASLARFRDYYQVPITSVHSPCLLFTRRTWGTDPWEKLDQSVHAAQRLGAQIVVVHPPFRWQRSYASGFTQGIRRLNEATGVTVAVENMYPWRGPVGTEIRAYAPSWDPSELDCDHLTLDLSHAATARQDSLRLIADWGERLAHVHLTDGVDGVADQHLLPGEGNQRADLVLEALADGAYQGHVAIEVKTNQAKDPAERATMLARTLVFTRQHLAVPVGRSR